MGDLLRDVVLRNIPPAPAAPIGPDRPAGDGPLHLATVYRRPGVGQRLACHDHIFTELRCLLRGADFRIKFRTLVFLHTNHALVITALQIRHAQHPVIGGGEAALERTFVVGLQFELGNLLLVGIGENHGETLIVQGVIVVFVAIIISGNSFEADCLAGPIDGAIGKDKDVRVRAIRTSLITPALAT